MSTELSDDDVAMHLSSSPQIISAETILSASGGDAASSRAAAGAAGAAGGSCSVELGRRLLLAARAGDTGLVLELMTKGAPFSTDWLGTSPLHLAAANNHAETCGVLLRAGVSRDARTKVERTPLHLAAAAGHADVVRLLLDAGAAVHCRDMLRMTPLHWAAARGQLGAARLLLRHGADPRLRCKFRKTPRCLALRAARPDLVALLEEAEASDAVSERVIEEDPLKPEQEYKNIHKFEIKPQSKVKIQSDKRIIIESKTQPIPASAKVGRAASTPAAPAAPAPGSPAGAGGGGSAGGGGNASAAALLKAHGITLLPADKGSTVLTALRSGRTVVLSDAGKLMLKESTSNSNENQFTHATTHSNVVHGAASQNTSATITCAAGTFSVETLDVTGEGARVQPARLPKGVKLVTLNKPQPVKRVIHPNDLQQVKVVRVPAAGKPPQSLPQSPGRRPALKIVVDKAHLQRLLAASRPGAQTNAANNCAATDPLATDPIDITVDDDSQHAGGDSLRAQLTHAHAAIASLGAELRACRARLAHYEGADPQ